MRLKIIIYLFLFAMSIFAKFITIQKADIIKVLKTGKKMLIGDVAVSYGFYGVLCDTVIVNSDYNSAELYGNITLWDTLRTIKCKKADLFRGKIKQQDNIYLYKNVIIDQDSIKIYGDKAHFSGRFNNLEVEKNASAKYFPYPSYLKAHLIKFDDQKKAIFAYNVKNFIYTDSVSKYMIKTKELQYLTQKQIVNLNFPFKITSNYLKKEIHNFDSLKYTHFDSIINSELDSLKGFVTLEASKGKYDILNGKIDLENNCIFTFVDSLKDTTIIKSKKAVYNFSSQKLILKDEVSVVRDTISATSDYATYSLDSSLLKLSGNPQIHYQNDFAKGDSIFILFSPQNNYMDKISLKGKCFIENMPQKENPKEKNSISGKAVEIFFNKNKDVENIIVSGEAQTKYFSKSQNKKSSTGSNYVNGDILNIKFKNGNISSIHLKGGCQGTYFPKRLKYKVLEK